MRYLPESLPGYPNNARRAPVPIGLDADTVTVPLSLGAITTAARVADESTFACFAPNLIVARSRPTPCSVTLEPAAAWLGVTELICGHAMPDAMGRPSPVARSKPFAVFHVLLCPRVRSLFPGDSIDVFVQLIPRLMSTSAVPYTFNFASALIFGARLPMRPPRQPCATSAITPAISGAAMLVPPTAVHASGGVAKPES